MVPYNTTICIFLKSNKLAKVALPQFDKTLSEVSTNNFSHIPLNHIKLNKNLFIMKCAAGQCFFKSWQHCKKSIFRHIVA